MDIKLGQISAKCVLASRNSTTGSTIYTWVTKQPRIIQAELVTHGLLTINSSSSRAVPLKKLREKVTGELFLPRWTVNQKGMTSRNYLEGLNAFRANLGCKSLFEKAHSFHEDLEKWQVHKQHANRYLEPWMMIQTVITATELKNFYKLRNHEAAQPEFQELATKMLESAASAPVQTLKPGDWHIPLVTEEQRQTLTLEELLKSSAAQTARASYYLPNTGDVADVPANIRLYTMLSNYGHMSPMQHPAMCIHQNWMSGNLCGFIPLRKALANETNGDVSVEKIMTPHESYEYMSCFTRGMNL